ncbi:jg26753 [Pararge aegeria aegeria]|uniref:Jg26753 protein n=1 Tax=Pararge aegeria aegeria TaxID=348720 RepID=A0A8S4SBI9_9NEOP|nr:jg26753 [Pararge aegeria aegeria]
MPLLTYTFGILKWTQTELDTLDCKVRKLLTANRMHHPRSSVMRLYIPRKCGGRGLLNAKNPHNREFGDLFGETEGFVFAFMDEVIKTRNYRKHIMKDGTLDIRRACRPGESLRHILDSRMALWAE